MKGKILTTLSLVAISSSSFAGSLFGGEIGVYYLNQNISGWIQNGTSKVDTKSDLGYDNKGTYGVKLSVDNPTGIFFVPNFAFEYMKVDFSGTHKPSQASFNYGGATFKNKGDVTSNLKLNHYDFIFNWSLIKKEKVDLRMGISIRGYNYDTKIVQDNTVGKKKEDIWVPMFYMSVKASPSDWLDLIFSEKVMTYSGNNFSDLDIEARFYPISSIFKPFISIGYKKEGFSLDDKKGISSALTFDQPYIGLGMSF